MTGQCGAWIFLWHLKIK